MLISISKQVTGLKSILIRFYKTVWDPGKEKLNFRGTKKMARLQIFAQGCSVTL